MRCGRGSDAAVTMLVAGFVTCLAGCLTDEKILKERYGEEGPRTASPRPRTGIRFPAAPQPTVDPRAGWKHALSFAFNTWKEKEDGEPLDYPGDFDGIGDRFATANQVAFGLKTGITRSYTRLFRLWDQTKTMIYEKEKEVEASDAGHVYALQFKPGDLKPGTYVAAWSIDGEEICSTTIVIVGR